MITFLRKIFIKNYQNVENETVRVAHGKLGAIFGIVSNFLLFSGKLIVGIIANSVSVISDSINNLSDMASSTVTLIGFKMSNKPADKEHPFGHQRIEYISGLIVSIVIIVLAIELLRSSIERIVTPAASTYTIATFIVLGVAVVLKLIQSYVNFSLGKTISSVALKATALDSLTDSIVTLIIFISSLVAHFVPGLLLDGWLGCLVALFVCYSGIKMLKETANPLIGTFTSKDIIDKVKNDIVNFNPMIIGVHDILYHSYGPTKVYMSAHAEVSASTNLVSAHEVIDHIEKLIKQKYDIELVLHLDPIDTTNPETKTIKELVEKLITDLSRDLQFHDFRVVRHEEHTDIVFDLVVPYDFIKSDEDISFYLENNFHYGEKKYLFVIHFDRPFDD